MTLAIGIDATAWTNERGDGRFVRNAVGSLVALHPEVEWALYLDAADVERVRLPDGARARPVRQRRRPSEALAAGSARGPGDLGRLALAVLRDRPDAFLSPSVYSWFPAPRVPSVVGLHDATATTHGRLVLPGRRDRALWRVKQALALRSADRLFTVSADARRAIAASLGLEADRIAVVPEAADPVFAPRPEQRARAELGEIGLGPAERPIVFAAGLSPHKGVTDLIEAYAGLCRGGGVEPRGGTGEGPIPKLIVAGSIEGPYPSAARGLMNRVAELGIPDRVRFPGFLSDEQLACLYSVAAAAIVPSHSEGFGLSALEAAACGAPVVLTDLGAHRETLDGAALFFRPGDSSALRARLEELLADRRSAAALGQRGIEAAARLSWSQTAARLHALLLEVI